MGLKTYKPTTPSLRFTAGPSFEDITEEAPRAVADQRTRSPARAATPWAGSRSATAAAGTSGSSASSISSATSTMFRRRWRRSSTIRTARRASRCWTTRMARSATSWRPNGVKVGATLVAGPKVEPVEGNALPLSAIPLGMPVHTLAQQRVVAVARAVEARPAPAAPARPGPRRCPSPGSSASAAGQSNGIVNTLSRANSRFCDPVRRL